VRLVAGRPPTIKLALPLSWRLQASVYGTDSYSSTLYRGSAGSLDIVAMLAHNQHHVGCDTDPRNRSAI
jgi:hypothetical protein